MGDTGAMAIGGAIAAMAIMMKVELLMLFVGGIFAIEAISVMLQVISFKYWGRRIFLMAPIHHHFEMKAWSETKIMVRFWIVTGDLLRRRLRALLQVLPPVPRAQLRALVYGLARSGRSAAERLERSGASSTARSGNEDDLSLLDGVEVLVKSPGVPGEAPLVAAARERGIPVWSEVELGYRLLPDAKFVGVTGTNGKTTTTELLGTIFRAAGRDVAVAGNVGTPLTSVRSAEWVVCELSSLPARGRARARVRRRRAAQPGAGPSRPARLVRGLPRREAPDLRALARAGRAARHRACRGSSSPPTTSCPPSR